MRLCKTAQTHFLYVISANVLIGFAFDGNVTVAILEHDHRGTRNAIVIRRHCVVICPCCEYCEDISARSIGRECNVFLQYVTALTATTYHRTLEGVALVVYAIGKQNGIGRAVQRKARIVGHTAIDRGIILEALDGLDRADGIERHTRIGNDASARLHTDRREGERVRLAKCLDRLTDLGNRGQPSQWRTWGA